VTNRYFSWTGDLPVGSNPYAAALLDETPAWSVAEVAARSGFADSNYFSRQFRRRFGVAPREFRRRGTPS
jgi:AraC-like DNA-binding protein